MSRELSRRRLLASTGLLASSVGLGAAAGVPSSRSADESAPDAFDEPSVTWSEAYARATSNNGLAVVEGDGQYVVLAQASTGQQRAGWLFGVDAESGRKQWGATVTNDDLERQPNFTDAVAAPDGGYVLSAADLDNGELVLVKTDGSGAVQWWRSYAPEASGDQRVLLSPQTVVRTDAGHVVGGYLLRGQNFTAVTLTVDADGAELSRTSYFADKTSSIIGLAPHPDGGVVAAGEVGPPADVQDRTIRGNLFRIGPDREVKWQREHATTFEGPTGQSQFRDVVPVDSGYVAVGMALRLREGDTVADGWGVRTDATGSAQVNTRISARNVTIVNGATEGTDGVVVVGQTQESTSGRASDAFVFELDGALEPRWSHVTAPDDTNGYVDALTASDGGLVSAGSIGSTSQNADPASRVIATKLGGEGSDSDGGPGPWTPTDGASSTPPPTVETADSSSPTQVEGGTGSPTPTPTATPTSTPTATPTSTAAATPTETASGPLTPTDSSSGSGPGFGVGTGLAALGTGALLVRRRLRDDGE